MKIYLIRHGQTTGDIEDRYGGDYEDYLSHLGEKQCEDLAKQLVKAKIQIIFHSPKIRAKQTAKILTKKLRIPQRSVKDFRERNNYGVLTGMVKSKAKKKFPQEVAKLQKDKLRHFIKNSEDYESFKKRVIKGFNTIFSKNKYKTIAIISHGGVISCFIREYLHKGELSNLGDCAVIELKKERHNLSIVKLNNAKLKKVK